MKDLNRLFNECYEELDAIEIPYVKPIKITVSSRTTRRYGQCKKLFNGFEINISSFLLDDRLDDVVVKTTIIHELVHTINKCFNHGEVFKKYARLISDCYCQYDIATTATQEHEKEVNKFRELKPKEYKYNFKCENCGQIIKRQKNSDFVKRYKLYTCGNCKGNFIKIK